MLKWSWMNVLTQKRYDALLERFGDVDTALAHVHEELLRGLGCKEETAFAALNRLDEFDPAAYEAALKKRGIRLISREDEEYPSALLQIQDPPVFLYFKGDIQILSQPCIALVGTRKMSSYGKRVTEEFVPALVRAGCITVSGLAEGIDTQVAKETLAAGGRTVAVLGHGLGSLYPKSNAALAEKIVETGGLVLSEYPLDAPSDRFTFPARNRIIAALSAGTVVLEAAEGSGSIITADLALEYSREVFAVPGDIFNPNYEGCHACIARGQARLVSTPADVLQEVGIVSPSNGSKASYKAQNAAEEAVLKALTTLPQSSGELVERSGLAAAEISATLTMMELAGAAKNTGDGLWVRV